MTQSLHYQMPSPSMPSNDVAQQLTALKELYAQKEKMDLEIKELRYKLFGHQSEQPMLDTILLVVSKKTAISQDKIVGQSRKANIAIARHLYMFFARNYSDASLRAIGALCGGRDHSTVINSIVQIRNWMDYDDKLVILMDEIRAEILDQIQLFHQLSAKPRHATPLSL